MYHNDALLRTIKLTDNIFALKDKLPEPSYDGKSHRKLEKVVDKPKAKHSMVIESDEEGDIGNQKMERIMPLSYITPLQNKKSSIVSQPNG